MDVAVSEAEWCDWDRIELNECKTNDYYRKLP